MTEVSTLDPTGPEAVLTHSLRCHLHPDYEPECVHTYTLRPGCPGCASRIALAQSVGVLR